MSPGPESILQFICYSKLPSAPVTWGVVRVAEDPLAGAEAVCVLVTGGGAHVGAVRGHPPRHQLRVQRGAACRGGRGAGSLTLDK